MSSMSLCAYPDSNIYTIMILQLWSCRRTGSPINPMDDLSLYFFVVLHRDPKKPVPPTFHPLPPPPDPPPKLSFDQQDLLGETI